MFLQFYSVLLFSLVCNSLATFLADSNVFPNYQDCNTMYYTTGKRLSTSNATFLTNTGYSYNTNSGQDISQCAKDCYQYNLVNGGSAPCNLMMIMFENSGSSSGSFGCSLYSGNQFNIINSNTANQVQVAVFNDWITPNCKGNMMNSTETAAYEDYRWSYFTHCKNPGNAYIIGLPSYGTISECIARCESTDLCVAIQFNEIHKCSIYKQCMFEPHKDQEYTLQRQRFGTAETTVIPATTCQETPYYSGGSVSLVPECDNRCWTNRQCTAFRLDSDRRCHLYNSCSEVDSSDLISTVYTENEDTELRTRPPTPQPTNSPTTREPTRYPTGMPTSPTVYTTQAPTSPVPQPTVPPTPRPTQYPTPQPSSTCYTDSLYSFVQVGPTGVNNITDVNMNSQMCPLKPFIGTFRSGLVSGTPLISDPDAFDALAPSTKLSMIQRDISDPYVVDVASMTDAEINESCLTAADCRVPPLLGIIRKVSDDSLYRPNVNTNANGYRDLTNAWCCATNQYVEGFEYYVRNSNRNTIARMYPAVRQQFRQTATLNKIITYPSGSSVADAKILRVEFTMSSTKLYIYVDNTCNDLKGNHWANGFYGNQGRTAGGFFHEVIFSGGNNLPNTHGPADQSNGPRPTNTNKFTVQYMGNFDGSSTTMEWAATKNFWYTVSVGNSDAGNKKMAGAHLKTALEWLFLAPPKGNLAVGLLYVFASKLYIDKLGNNKYTPNNLDFSLVIEHQGDFYTFMKPLLDYLNAVDPSSSRGYSRIYHALIELDGYDNCKDSMMSDFYVQFMSERKPPEQGCLGASPLSSIMDCARWHSRRCSNTIRVLYEARAIQWSAFHNSMPQCSECPGLIGWWRSGATVSPYQKILDMGVFPQCLPFMDNTGLKSDLGFDMNDGSSFSIDYEEGFTCHKDGCRFTDVLDVDLSVVTEAVPSFVCANSGAWIATTTTSTLELCRQTCYSEKYLTCASFSYNTNTRSCKMYSSCPEITSIGATSADTVYIAKPHLTDTDATWDDPAVYTDISQPTPYPTSPTRSPTLPTSSPTSPTRSPTTRSPTAAPTTPSPTNPGETRRPTSSPTPEPTTGTTGTPTTRSPTSVPTSPTSPTVPPTGAPTFLTMRPTTSPTAASTTIFENTLFYVIAGASLFLIIIWCCIIACCCLRKGSVAPTVPGPVNPYAPRPGYAPSSTYAPPTPYRPVGAVPPLNL